MVLSQMDAGRALTSAAAKGNTGDVRRILEERRVHPDTLNEFGRTALQVHVLLRVVGVDASIHHTGMEDCSRLTWITLLHVHV